MKVEEICPICGVSVGWDVRLCGGDNVVSRHVRHSGVSVVQRTEPEPEPVSVQSVRKRTSQDD